MNIKLEQAQKAIEAAVKQAKKIDVKMNILQSNNSKNDCLPNPLSSK